MRRLAILSLFCLFFFITTCTKKPSPVVQTRSVSAEEAVLRAEQVARKAHLPGDLAAAGTHAGKLAKVYRDAEELGAADIQAIADKKLYEILISTAEQATWSKTIKRLKKIAPASSHTHARLQEILQTQEVPSPT